MKSYNYASILLNKEKKNLVKLLASRDKWSCLSYLTKETIKCLFKICCIKLKNMQPN